MAQGSPDSNPVKMNLSDFLAQQAKIKANEDSNYMATMKDMRAEQDNTDHNWLINPGHYSSNQSASRNIQIDTVLDKIVIHVDQLSDSYAQIHEQVSKALKTVITKASTSSSTVQTRGIGGNDKTPGPERQPAQNISFNVTPNQLPVDKTRYSIQPTLHLDLPPSSSLQTRTIVHIHTFERSDDKTTLKLISNQTLEQPGPLGEVHIYRYQKPDGDYLTYSYDEIYKGNYLGETYVGPDNPQKDGKDDYNQAPQDFIDYQAYRHDLAYDKFNAKGADDAKNNLDVLHTDKALVQGAEVAKVMYNYDMTDPITGNKATFDEKVTAQAVITYFTPIIKEKQKAIDYIVNQLKSTNKSVEDIVKDYNSKNKTQFKTSKGKDDFLGKKDTNGN